MKKPIWALLLTICFALPVSADTVEELDQWFRDGYAALYTENAWDHADQFAQYFADVITYRSDNGRVQSDANGFVVESLDDWRAEGWVGTDVAALDTRLLNATTVVFNVKWRDRNADGSTEFECGYYLADKTDGDWLLSEYISMACTD